MERCPICRASLSERPVCRRCKSDLSLPLAIEEEAGLCLQSAIRELLTGDLDGAEESAARALLLHKSSLAKAIAGFSHWLRTAGEVDLAMEPPG